MRVWIKIASCVVLGLSLAGCCTIHEYPGECRTSLRITRLDFDRQWGEQPAAAAWSRGRADGFDLRVTVELYPESGSVPMIRRTVTFPDPYNDTYESDILFADLPRAQYQVVAWADYVASGTVSDLYYDTSDLTLITPRGAYEGNQDMRDAFFTSQPVDLRSVAEIALTLPLGHPFARYKIIATDLQKYMEQTGATAADVAGMTVGITYQGYFPCGFNALTGKPNDARTGIAFTGAAVTLDDPSELLLAYDYVWVNGTASSVRAGMVVYDRNGQAINNVGSIFIPYKVGEITIIKDEYLTGKFNPGIGIDDEWNEDDINWVIPD